MRAGADLVVGGHPHVVQGLEPVGEAVVAHSLGNFVFDMDFLDDTMEGVTLAATFRGDRLVDVELGPYRMGTGLRPAAGHRRRGGGDPGRRARPQPGPVPRPGSLR